MSTKKKSLLAPWLFLSAFYLFVFIPQSLSSAPVRPACSSCSIEASIEINDSSSQVMTNNEEFNVNVGDFVSITWTLLENSCAANVAPILYLTGTSPNGMQFKQNGLTATLFGTIEEPPGTYELSLLGSFVAPKPAPPCVAKAINFTLNVSDSSTVQPPEDLTVTQTPDIAGNQAREATRAKKDDQKYKNVLRWRAPISGPRVVAYQIYLDRDLQFMLGEIKSLDRKKIKVVHRRVNPCRNHKYFVVSVDEEGNRSRAVRGRIRGSRRHCLFDR